MANRTTRTPKKDTKFLTTLTATGNVSTAAQTANYGRTQLYQWRKDDTDFADAWDDAIEGYVEALEAEADRRAKDGVLKPVFYEGERVGEYPQFSDALLMFRLKALRPDKYRERGTEVTPAHASRKSPEQLSASPALTPEALQTIKRDVYGIYDDEDEPNASVQ